jgi:hypothetical protein
MAGWEDKDDLDLTADDIADMMAAGEPVEVVTPLSNRPWTVSLNWDARLGGLAGFKTTAVTYGTACNVEPAFSKRSHVSAHVTVGSSRRGGLVPSA